MKGPRRKGFLHHERERQRGSLTSRIITFPLNKSKWLACSANTRAHTSSNHRNLADWIFNDSAHVQHLVEISNTPTHPVCFYHSHCFGQRTGITSRPGHPDCPSPATPLLSAIQAQCRLTYCHEDTSCRPTSTLREWVINKP